MISKDEIEDDRAEQAEQAAQAQLAEVEVINGWPHTVRMIAFYIACVLVVWQCCGGHRP